MDRHDREKIISWLKDYDSLKAEDHIISPQLESEHPQASTPNSIMDFLDDTACIIDSGICLVNRTFLGPLQGSICGSGSIGRTDAYCINIKLNNLRLELINVNIRELRLTSNPGIVYIKGCIIDHLYINNDANIIHIIDSWIGDLNISNPNISIRTFIFHRGGIETITSRPPGTPNPFCGTVEFLDVYFPTKFDCRLDSPQPYRNIKSFMIQLDNTPAANFFHSLEHATERARQPFGLDRFISSIYALMSNYGASASRPIVTFILMFLCSTIFIFWFDGAALSNAAHVHNWQDALIGGSLLSRFSRAAILTLSATVNPLNIFTEHGCVMASNIGIETILFLYSIISTLCIALFFVALRRRFKIS